MEKEQILEILRFYPDLIASYLEKDTKFESEVQALFTAQRKLDLEKQLADIQAELTKYK
jgi:hypothetical protein